MYNESDGDWQFLELGDPIKGMLIGFGILVVAAACLIVSCVTGCTTEGPSQETRDFVTNIAMKIYVDVKNRPATEDGAGEGETPTLHGASVAGGLVFKYGGLDGSHAVEEPEAQISALHMSMSGMSYKWSKGGCEAFGAKDRSDYSRASACAFYWDEAKGQWIGGRFDSISTSRTTRSWNNIKDGYRRWDAASFFAAPKRAFCIVSADGKRRTNLLETKEP